MHALKLVLLMGFFWFVQNVQAQKSKYSARAKLLTTIRFEQLSGGVILIKGSLNDFKDSLNFILDTGSGGISIDSQTAVLYQLPLVATDKTIRGIGGVKTLNFYKGGTLNFQGLEVKNLDFYINDYEILSQVYGVKIDGIIGYSLMRRYIIALDYDLHLAKLYAPGSFRYPAGGVRLSPVFANIPIVREPFRSIRDYDASFYFDTGAGMCLLFSEQFVEDSAVLDPQQKIRTTQLESPAGKVAMKLTVLKRFQIGPYRFRKVPMYIYRDSVNVFQYPSIAGLIGNDLLRRFNVILNYPDRKIYLKPNRHYHDPFDYAYTGMNFYLIDGKIIITDVNDGSPAAAAGVRPGDQLLAVENNFSNNIQQYKALLQKHGETVALVIFRNEQTLFLSLKIASIL
jgi:hypothetical protein